LEEYGVQETVDGKGKWRFAVELRWVVLYRQKMPI
jgi:hypothetical protein